MASNTINGHAVGVPFDQCPKCLGIRDAARAKEAEEKRMAELKFKVGKTYRYETSIGSPGYKVDFVWPDGNAATTYATPNTVSHTILDPRRLDRGFGFDHLVEVAPRWEEGHTYASGHVLYPATVVKVYPNGDALLEWSWTEAAGVTRNRASVQVASVRGEWTEVGS